MFIHFEKERDRQRERERERREREHVHEQKRDTERGEIESQAGFALSVQSPLQGWSSQTMS